MLTQMQDYDRALPFIFRRIGKHSEDGIESQLLVTSSPFGYWRMAELIQPEGAGPRAAILYLHWYEPEAPDSNRSQFVAEAREMAKRGAACLLIETMWSDPDFFLKRTQQDDPQNSIRQVVDIRRAMDFLLAQPNIDPGRSPVWGMTSAVCMACWQGAWTNDRRTTSLWRPRLVSRTGTCMPPNWRVRREKHLSVKWLQSTRLPRWGTFPPPRSCSSSPRTISTSRANGPKNFSPPPGNRKNCVGTKPVTD